MHIPDWFLSTNVWALGWLISIAGISYCLKKASKILKDRMIPLMGVMASFIFVAQMINFPIFGGTSGHLLGAVLATVLLGPSAGAVVITVVLITQCFIFQDGGLIALGVNIFNMAIVGCFIGYFIYNIFRKVIKNSRGILIGVFLASWFSVVFSSSFCAIELAISGVSPFNIVFPAMSFVHIFIGLGEAIITSFVVSFVLKVRPDLIYKSDKKNTINRNDIILILTMAILIAVFIAPFASQLPDGLEKVAIDKGFLEKSKTVLNTIIPDYIFPGFKNEKLAVGIAGLTGSLVLFGVGYGLSKCIKKNK